MIIRFYKFYSKLDKEWKFSVTTDQLCDYMWPWLWFYLSKYLNGQCISLYPFYFKESKLVKEYNIHEFGSDQVAKWIASRIKSA